MALRHSALLFACRRASSVTSSTSTSFSFFSTSSSSSSDKGEGSVHFDDGSGEKLAEVLDHALVSELEKEEEEEDEEREREEKAKRVLNDDNKKHHHPAGQRGEAQGLLLRQQQYLRGIGPHQP